MIEIIENCFLFKKVRPWE